MSTKRQLSFFTALFAFVSLSGVSQAQLFGFEHCWFTLPPPPQMSLGQQLAAADRLEDLAEPYDNFPYRRCYNLGLSCSRIAPQISNDAVEEAHLRCRGLYPVSTSLPYDQWVIERTAYNECVAGDLRRQTDEVRAEILDPVPAAPIPETLVEGAAAEGSLTLDASASQAATTDVTWCPANGAAQPVAILCKGGGMVVSDRRGQNRLQFRVTRDGDLCLWNFQATETCHQLVLSETGVRLDPEHETLTGSFTVMEDVKRGIWEGSCARR